MAQLEKSGSSLEDEASISTCSGSSSDVVAKLRM
jgi:hypothetical protein